MFNGIVETIGIITAIRYSNECKYFSITPKYAFDDLSIGQSIAINGACLTITNFSNEDFNVTAVPETLKRTNLDSLLVGDCVNLERSMQLEGRIHGHYVQGHIEAVGQITELQPEGDAIVAKVMLPEHLAKYLVPKGYIAIDGMSITIINTEVNAFTMTLIPHTRQVTIANHYRVGSFVNLETDILGKYIEKLLTNYIGAPPNVSSNKTR